MAAIVNPTTSLLSLVFTVIFLFTLCLSDAQKSGFSVELIHRDSSKSPMYNHLETTYDRLKNALGRSFNRVHRFQPTSITTRTPQADVIVDSGEYLLNISIGSPSFPIIALADTGSDLIWIQCKPCSECYEQDAPLFNPSNSSTYETISCAASQCENLYGSSCSRNNTCEYLVSYGDFSFSNGDLATEMLMLPSTNGQPVAVPQTVIGCGRHNFGTFDQKTSGMIGLGGGNFSLISQMAHIILGKFSYCLLPLTKTGESSKMNFGQGAIVSGNGVVSTPLTKKDPPTYYFLTLEAISVGSMRINFTGSSFGSEDGNIIIDSGTTFTFVPHDFYSELESAASSQINATRVDGPEGLHLCYNATIDFAVPNITVHFTDADVELQPLNTFVLVSDAVACFAFTYLGNLSIYGNLAQMNFLVGYDSEKQTVSFLPKDCCKN